MNTQSIEELRAQLAAAEQKLYEEKQELLRKEREAKYEAERIARAEAEAKAMLAWEAVAKEIVKELKAVGFINANYILPPSGKYPTIRCFAADNYEAWQVAFDTTYSRDKWSSRGTGTIIKVGQYGEANRYPQLKDGGFSYKKIAATAWDKYQTELAKKKRANTEEENKTANKAHISRLVNQFGKPAYKGADYNQIKGVSITSETYHSNGRGHNSFSYRTDNDLMLKVDHITEENAAKLIQFMLDNGMINNEEK